MLEKVNDYFSLYNKYKLIFLSLTNFSSKIVLFYSECITSSLKKEK